MWPRPRSRRPRGTASPGRGLGPHRRPRPAALTCEPRPGPSITPRSRPAAAPAQSGGRGSRSTPQPPLAHFRLALRPPNCAHTSAANPPREANPRPLSHGGGTFSPLENSRSSPPSAPPTLCSFLHPHPWHLFRFPLRRLYRCRFRLLSSRPQWATPKLAVLMAISPSPQSSQL